MRSWTKDEALRELKTLIVEADNLENGSKGSAPHTRWCARVLTVFEEVFGQESRYYASFEQLPWEWVGASAGWLSQIERVNMGKDREAYRTQLGTAKGLLLAAVDELRRSNIGDVYKGKDTPHEASSLLKIISLAERKLRKVMRGGPKKETEIQDAMENLLVGADIQYSREAEAIEYSSKTYKPDFVVRQVDLAIEMKLCSREGREKEIIAEINDDILAYQTGFRNLLFVVYDLGFIRDVERFASSFEDHDNVIVRVVKH